MTTSVSTRATGTLNPTRQQLDELDALLQRMLELPVHPLDEPEPADSEEPAEEPPLALIQRSSPANLPLAEIGQRTEDGEQRTAGREQRPAESRQRTAPPPVSYMVVETASPRPLPPASGFEPRPPILAPRLVPVTPETETPAPPSPIRETPIEPPVPETDEGETWVPLRSTWKPSAQTWPPLAESWHQANSNVSPVAEPRLLADPRPDPMPQRETVSQTALEVQPSEPDVMPSPTEGATALAPAPVPTTPGPRLTLSAQDAPTALPVALLPLLWFNQGFDTCLAPLGAPGRWLCGSGRSMLGLLGLMCLAAAVILGLLTGMGWNW